MTRDIWELVQEAFDIDALHQRLLDMESAKQKDIVLLDGWTLLHYICDNVYLDAKSRVEALKLILQYQPASANNVDQNGWNPLQVLCRNKCQFDISASLNLLVSKSKLNVNDTTTDQKVTALHILCANTKAFNSTGLKILLDAKADVNLRDSDNCTALHNLVQNENLHEESIFMLCEKGADANMLNKFGMSAFHYLCQNSKVNPQMIKIMFRYDADPVLPSSIGNTALHYLCENWQLGVDLLAAFLANKRVQVTTRNSLGCLAFDGIDKNKTDCLEYVKQLAASEAIATNACPLSKSDLGGEDPQGLPTSLQHILLVWNNSLPPFDMAFYTATCCDELFAQAYHSLQDVSLKLIENPSDNLMIMNWKASLAKWRGLLVLAYAASLHPDTWEAEAQLRNRSVPADLTAKKTDILSVWNRHQDLDQYVQRVESIESLLT